MILTGLIWEDPTHGLVIKHQPDCRIMPIRRVVGTSNKKEIHLAGNMKKILQLVEDVKVFSHMVRVNEEPGKHVWHVVFKKDKPLIIKEVIFESMHFEFDPNVSLVIRAATDGGHVAGGAPAPVPAPAPASGEDGGLTDDDESGGGPAKKKRRRAVTYAECVAMARARSAKDGSGARKEAP
jgi:hypothetical protein